MPIKIYRPVNFDPSESGDPIDWNGRVFINVGGIGVKTDNPEEIVDIAGGGGNGGLLIRGSVSDFSHLDGKVACMVDTDLTTQQVRIVSPAGYGVSFWPGKALKGWVDEAGLHIYGDIHCTGKLTSDGGNDPPYVLYDAMTRDKIREKVRSEVPQEKWDGAVLFYNSEAEQMELYFPSKDQFKVLYKVEDH